MSSRTLTILFGTFLALLAVVLLQYATPTLFAPKQSEYEKAIQSVNIDSVKSITIQKQHQSLNLTKKDTSWLVNEKKASQEKIDDLVTQLIRSPKATIVAQTNTRHADLEVTDALATSVAFDNTLSLLVGKSELNGIYIRIKGTDPVYLLSTASAATISSAADDWYDKTITKIDEKNISKLSFVKPTEQFTLLQDNGSWKFAEGNTPVESATITSLLADLTSFQAQSLADEATAAAYPQMPELTLTIEKKDDKEELVFFTGTDEYLVRRSSDTQRFIIPASQAKHFLFSPTTPLPS